MTHVAIIIPARYASTRFPGKPLALLGGQAMLSHVYENAIKAAEGFSNMTVAVATDDARIEEYCKTHKLHYFMTSADCHTGSDRVIEAASQLLNEPSFVINMQGDAPFTPFDFIRAMIDEHLNDHSADIITPVTQLTWQQLDNLREDKKTTPFSGTTAVLDRHRNALWFSKNIIPALRKEDRSQPFSPIYRHIGLYGYRWDALQKYKTLSPSVYENLEGLEQLRALENGMKIRAVIVDYKNRPSMSGIDSPEDLQRAEKLLMEFRA